MSDTKVENKEEESLSGIDLLKRVSRKFMMEYVPDEPTQFAAEGITYDFNMGLRIKIPLGAPKNYRVRVWDADTGNTIQDQILKPGDLLMSGTVYFRRYMFSITDAADDSVEIFNHLLNLRNQTVVVSFDVNTVGDVLAWFSAVEKFRMVHGCHVVAAMRPYMAELLQKEYPEIEFCSVEDSLSCRSYARYFIGVDFEGETIIQPYDWRHSCLTWVSWNILGLDPRAANGADVPPDITFNTDDRKIQEPYVCISAMASGGCKLWMNPTGWDNVVKFLKNCGYRVICIDGINICGQGITYQKIPAGAEDFTGKTGEGKTLADRAAMIYHADFFIGLGSGLSWLAWAVNKRRMKNGLPQLPIVLISGFSLPYCEFDTPYRVINNAVCHGCFNNPKYTFDGSQSFWCPEYAGTKKHAICTLSISSWQVIHTIGRIPQFQEFLSSNGLKAVIEVDTGKKNPFAMKVVKNASNTLTKTESLKEQSNADEVVDAAKHQKKTSSTKNNSGR